jgi:hypothetical protein
MSDGAEAAAAVTIEQTPAASAVVEQATPKPGIQDVDAAPENADDAKAKTEETAGDKPEGEEERKRLTRNQRLQRKAARLSTMVAEQATEIERLRQATSKDADAEPKEADFNGDYLAYQRALSKWDTKQLLKEKASA